MVFGAQVADTLAEFGASFFLPHIDSQSESLLSNSDNPSQDTPMKPKSDVERLQFAFSSKCDWNHALSANDDYDLQGFVTGFVSRVGSSNDGSDRGNQNLSARGNASKQLVFVNGRPIDYKKAGNRWM